MTQLAYNFASGALFGTRTDQSNPTPVRFGVLQDVQIDFAGTNKELYGQNQFPQDVARGPIKVTGKAKSAQIFSQYFDLFFGDGVTPATGVAVALSEAHTVASTTQTVTNAATFSSDLGVSYAATGIPLVRVAPSSEVAGKYSVNTSTGVYTFASADEVALLFSYEYGVTSGFNEILMVNQLMGSTPTFAIVLATTYKGNVMNIHLNQAISEKLSIPIKNQDYTILEFDFSAYADAAGNLGKLTFSQ